MLEQGTVAPADARVAVVSEEPILSHGLASLLDAEPGFSCESVCGDFATAIGMVGDGKLEALVVDEPLVVGAQAMWTAEALARSRFGCVVVIGRDGGAGAALTASLGGRGSRVDKSVGTAAVTAALRQLLDGLGWRFATA